MGVVEIREDSAEEYAIFRQGAGDRPVCIRCLDADRVDLPAVLHHHCFVQRAGRGCEWAGMAVAQGLYAGRLSRIAEAL